MNLADYDVLSFDCYGTLIDWEAGILEVLRPWAQQAGSPLSDDELLAVYAVNEAQAQRDSPSALYPRILADAFVRTGGALNIPVSGEWADKLGASVSDWPAFEDSADALSSLGESYKLVILSNVHRDGFAGSNRRLGVRFDAIVTAEDVKAYKPADNHFEALDGVLETLGVRRSRLLHGHDRPGWGATPEPPEEYSVDMKFPSMAAFAAAAREARSDA